MSLTSSLSGASFDKEALHASIPVLVDFWAPWCQPCALMSPVVAELAREFKGKLKVHTVNVDDEPDLTERYGIQSIPTILIFVDGSVVRQRVGAAPRSTLLNLLQGLV